MNIIWEKGKYRIIEMPDTNVSIRDLEGDIYNPDFHPEIPREQVLQERQDFRDLVNREGVFGYELQRWNRKIGEGWEHVDSCWGFIGQYSETDESFKHDIVQEMIDQTKPKRKKKG